MRRLLSERVGYELPKDFYSFMVRQSRAAARELGLGGLSALAAELDRSAPGTRVWIRFISRITIGESYLFRNPNHMDLLRRIVLPELLKRSKRRPVAIWSAGCARGEEPYTLAIMLRELTPDIAERDIRIVATDIDADALEAARRAHYGAWAFRQTPYHIQRKYFTRASKQSKELVLHPSLGSLVSFGYHHVALDKNLSAFPDTGFDLILCRNVLMYLRHDFRRRAGRGLASRLAPGGFLIPGQVERIDGADDDLERMFVHGSGVYFPREGGSEVRQLLSPFARRGYTDPAAEVVLPPPLRETAPELEPVRRNRKPTDPTGSSEDTETSRSSASAEDTPGVETGTGDRAASSATGAASAEDTAASEHQPHGEDSEEQSPGLHDEQSGADGEADDDVLPSGELALLSADMGASETPSLPRQSQRASDVDDAVSKHLDALTASELYDTVRALVSAGEIDAAIEHCLALIEQEPLEAKHHCLLALVQIENEAPSLAIDALRRAIYCDPDSITAYYIWWLIGVRYHGASWTRTRWARRHLVRLIGELPDDFELPLVGRVTAGDVRYLLQRDWHSF